MSNNRGGIRDGQGRKPDRGERKETVSMRLTPELIRFLREQPETMANVVEDAIRRTKGFRDWSKGQ